MKAQRLVYKIIELSNVSLITSACSLGEGYLASVLHCEGCSGIGRTGFEISGSARSPD